CARILDYYGSSYVDYW
nr:immunoglobulin heavy chain junction region [Mus musculus]